MWQTRPLIISETECMFAGMQVFHTLEEVPADFGPCMVSVGNFDGVHRAHRPYCEIL